MSNWLRGLTPWAVALLRVVLGVAMVYHGWPKIAPAHGLHGDLLSGVQHYNGFVARLGLPGWLGYVSAATEFFGGGLLLLGLLTRFAAFMVAGNMLVALFAVDLHHGYAGSDYVLALVAMAVLLITTGGGAASVDQRVGLS